MDKHGVFRIHQPFHYPLHIDKISTYEKITAKARYLPTDY